MLSVRSAVVSCFRQARARDPNLSGSGKIIVAYAPSGGVQSVKVTGSFPPDLQACLDEAAKRIIFPPAQPGTTAISIPILAPKP